jgi:hypothetical protein
MHSLIDLKRHWRKEDDIVRLFKAVLIFLCAKSSLKYGRPINLIKD